MRDVDPKSAGRWREEQVWIGGGTHGPRGAMFVPPHHSRVVAAIDDLLGFAQRNDVPVLPQIALAHPQFETIHPFTDGNGRTGRALLQAMLRREGLTRNVTVPVSAGLLTDTDFYFAALTAYREGDPAPIVRRVAEAAVTVVFNGRELVSEFHATRAEWNDRITARSDSAVWQIADLLLRRRVSNTALLTEELGIDSKHARRYLEPLSDAGIIVESSSGPRSRVWRSPGVIAALDAFADRARRGGLGRWRAIDGQRDTPPKIRRQLTLSTGRGNKVTVTVSLGFDPQKRQWISDKPESSCCTTSLDAAVGRLTGGIVDPAACRA